MLADVPLHGPEVSLGGRVAVLGGHLGLLPPSISVEIRRPASQSLWSSLGRKRTVGGSGSHKPGIENEYEGESRNETWKSNERLAKLTAIELVRRDVRSLTSELGYCRYDVAG